MRDKYYHWLVSLVCDEYHAKYYNKLLSALYGQEFYWSITRDEDRAIDGINLRRRYIEEHCKGSGYKSRGNIESVPTQDDPCTLLEMMAAMAIRCEIECFGYNSDNDMTDTWFWNMIINLGLDKMDDGNFKPGLVHNRVLDLLDRQFEPNGKYGLFTVEGRTEDMRDVDFWMQMMWYIADLDLFGPIDEFV